MRPEVKDHITLTVNQQLITVNSNDVSPHLSLARFLRERIHLTGTKISCEQGGCGACVVTATIPDPNGQDNKVTMGVNSCLIPILSCDNWEVTTIEGLGSTKTGLSAVQERLATFHGTQCGFCTPGMVMTMNSLLKTDENLSVSKIENALDGNICRCTGFRPILDAFKSFASDAPSRLKTKVKDIEDIGSNFQGKCSNGNGTTCSKNGTCSSKLKGKASLVFKTETNSTWMQPVSLPDLFQDIKRISEEQTYKLVAGNTGTGIYEEKNFDAYIDISRVKELHLIQKTSSSVVVGAALSLTEMINLFEANGDDEDYSNYKEVADHWKKVANLAVRNVGTIGGNLMLKHSHREFPSDIFVTMEAVGAKIEIADLVSGQSSVFSCDNWLNQDMAKKIITKIHIPALKNKTLRSYKVSPRRQNAHCYVNGAILMALDNNFKVLEKPSIVFGGISPTFSHAHNLETFLVNQHLNDSQTLKKALKVLDQELVPDSDPVNASKEYRKHLAKAMLYKYFIAALGNTLPDSIRSGADKIVRGVSKGEQFFQTDPNLYPINQPIKKIEGKFQCTGEAEYISDIPVFPDELQACFVLATVANCDIAIVDPSPALDIPGVVAFIDHSDVPGQNNASIGRFPEEIFSSGKIHYAGQSIGLILAETVELAKRGASLVKVDYKNIRKPVLNIKEAVKTENEEHVQKQEPTFTFGEVDVFDERSESFISTPVKTIEGEFETGCQYHFSLETQTCLVRPIEDEQYEVFSATQWINQTQSVISTALGIPFNSLDMKVRRLGGAFGSKISKGNLIAAACAVAASVMNRPIRLILDIRTNMEMVGKRLPHLAKYRAMVTPEGKLKAVGMKIYCDCGYTFNTETASTAAAFAQNCYHSENWRIIPNAVLTNTPSNTYCRAPGSTEGHAIIENIMEHIAHELEMDPLEFRIKNILEKGDHVLFGSGSTMEDEASPITILIDQVKNSSKYAERRLEIEDFNAKNRWKKRGLSMVPIRYIHNYFGTKYHVLVSIYAGDGTVSVSHGGIEMGQGLNTKVAQVVAKELGISVDMIKVKSTNNLVGPNNSVTGGSMGSECCASGALIACREIKERMKKVKDKMEKSDPTWLELVKACNAQAVDISARHMSHPGNDGLKNYIVWGVSVVEVEVDVLTGEVNIRRADLIEDTGMAISPEVDVGQVEGGFVMGLGLWTTEHIKYDPKTGRLLTRDTWEYKPPASHDIPEDIRTTFFDSGSNPNGVLGSKATGEPSVMMGVAVMFAIRDALDSARKDNGIDSKLWYQMNGPATVENIQKSSGIGSDYFTL